ncbi:MAG: HAD-IIB family hydrolase [Gammaproteobacteria bacterium]|nr:HAD-IIB family hydrolase [Gammaproteobacteria bacterium]
MHSGRKKIVVFTDLDGSLLNHSDYSYAAALPAIKILKQLQIPLVLVSSKTFEEIRELSKNLELDYPFVCENGSVIVVPKNNDNFGLDAKNKAEEVEEYYFIYQGSSRENIVRVLDSMHDRYIFRGFSQMQDAEIADRTGLSIPQAACANRRLASEPVVWQDQADKLELFRKEIEKAQLRIVKGGRFYHIMGNTDKAEAVNSLCRAYGRLSGTTIHSIVVGDSENDLAMLRSASTAVVIPKEDGTHIRVEGNAEVLYALYPGALGWGKAIETLLSSLI